MPRWAGKRLPTEFEWEHRGHGVPVAGNMPVGRLSPRPRRRTTRPASRCSATSGNGRRAPISPYPGFRPAPGAVGEYNGKFMVQPAGAARRRPAPRPPAMPAPPTATSSIPTSAGSSPACAWRASLMTQIRQPPPAAAGAVDQRLRERRSAPAWRKPQKTLPCQFFYDARGCACSRQITELPEYYPTRTEIAILATAPPRSPPRRRPARCLVEFGSGSSRKTGSCSTPSPSLAAYVPIDMSRERARRGARAARAALSRPARASRSVGDFRAPLALPDDLAARPAPRLLPRLDHRQFRAGRGARLAAQHGARRSAPAARLMVGVDLRKDRRASCCRPITTPRASRRRST